MAQLTVTQGPDAGRTFPLDDETLSVGRGDDNRVQLTDLTVSRRHFEIEPWQTGWRLVDLGSRNRTSVNDLPVRSHVLIEGDVIAIGETRMTFGGVARSAVTVVAHAGETRTHELRGLAVSEGGERRLAALYEFAGAVALLDEPEALYGEIARLAREQTDAARVCLMSGDDWSRLDTVAEEGDGEPIELGADVLARVIDERISVAACEAASPRGRPRPFICAPAVSRGCALGVLALVGRPGEPAFAEDDVRFVTAIGQQAGIAIDNLRRRYALERHNAHLREQVEGRYSLIGESRAFARLARFIEKAAPTESTILFTGESGTGKEMAARGLHHASLRRSRPFVVVNCAALAETLLESELFGHEKGAFTGATARKKGRFEVADTGTLFLDEVGELSPTCQTRFLRVLEESRFERVGSHRTIEVDVRVVAATNRDLEAMVARGTFRQDLFYRLQVIQFELPPLRDRLGDISRLADYFVAHYAKRMSRRLCGLSPRAAGAIERHRWPGNVRELKNAIERAVVLGDGEWIELDDLPPAVARALEGEDTGTSPVLGGEIVELKVLERRAIQNALLRTGGNKVRAAQLLGIDRSTLYKRVREYGIDP